MNTCLVYNSDCPHEYLFVNLPRPVAPPELLQNLRGNEPLVMRDTQGSLYYWFTNGIVKKNDVNYETIYMWNPPPTLKDVLKGPLSNSHKRFYRFYSDGRVTWREHHTRKLSHWSPDPVGAVPVDGVAVKAYHNCIKKNQYGNCNNCIGVDCTNYQIKELLPPEFDEKNDDEWVLCPGCGALFDGYDYGGLGCSRVCAYGEGDDEW